MEGKIWVIMQAFSKSMSNTVGVETGNDTADQAFNLFTGFLCGSMLAEAQYNAQPNTCACIHL